MAVRLGVIWIGDESKRPDSLIQTWKDKHPNLEHVIFGNDYLKSRKWRNQKLIDEYLAHSDYPGVADVMRYEILLEEEFFIHPADSECLENIEELLVGRDIIAVYENEIAAPGLISPIYYAKPNYPFVRCLVENLPDSVYDEHGKYMKPWKWTGNKYMQKIYESRDWGFTPLPSYTFTPVHHTGLTYEGGGKIYARQLWGSTFKIYGTDKIEKV